MGIFKPKRVQLLKSYTKKNPNAKKGVFGWTSPRLSEGLSSHSVVILEDDALKVIDDDKEYADDSLVAVLDEDLEIVKITEDATEKQIDFIKEKKLSYEGKLTKSKAMAAISLYIENEKRKRNWEKRKILPPTNKQFEMLDALKIKYKDSTNRGEASKLISDGMNSLKLYKNPLIDKHKDIRTSPTYFKCFGFPSKKIHKMKRGHFPFGMIYNK